MKQQAKPSPISTNPAFSSPASTNMCGPSLGKVFNQTIEFLYEQCSDHITPKTLNSVKFGILPKISEILSNSSDLNPISLACSTVPKLNVACDDIFYILI